jgi:hypothetical protein
MSWEASLLDYPKPSDQTRNGACELLPMRDATGLTFCSNVGSIRNNRIDTAAATGIDRVEGKHAITCKCPSWSLGRPKAISAFVNGVYTAVLGNKSVTECVSLNAQTNLGTGAAKGKCIGGRDPRWRFWLIGPESCAGHRPHEHRD